MNAECRDFGVGEWMLDSGTFSDILKYGRHRSTPIEYATQVLRWSRCGRLVAAVSQDWLCSPLVLARTGLTVAEHQRLTIERYVALRDLVGSAAYVMPVLQGTWPEEYLSHLAQFNHLLAPGQWVGVGSLCKRNADPGQVERVLVPIHRERPDLLLHGFALKLRSLGSSLVRDCLYSADSTAWNYAAWKRGRTRNSWREALRFAERIENQSVRHRHYQEQLW
jgi:hypothetical protein